MSTQSVPGRSGVLTLGCIEHAFDRVTGLPDRNTDQIGQKCPKSQKFVFAGLGQFSDDLLFDSFGPFFRLFVTFLCSRLCNQRFARYKHWAQKRRGSFRQGSFSQTLASSCERPLGRGLKSHSDMWLGGRLV